MMNEDINARLKADSSTTANDTSVSQTNAKPNVSGSAFTVDDLRRAYNAGITKGKDSIDNATVNILGAWSSDMFDEWFRQHYR